MATRTMEILKEREKASDIVQLLEGCTYAEASRILECAQGLLRSSAVVTSVHKESIEHKKEVKHCG